MTLQEKADQARELLQNQAFKSVLRDTREQIVMSLERLPVAEVDLQHEGVLMLQLLKRFESQLQRYVDDWTVEQKKQAQDTWIAKQRQRFSWR